MIANVIQAFNHSVAHTIQLHIYMAQFPLLSSPLAGSPFAPPLCPLLLTWLPPAVTGIVHLSLRLLVNWPHLPHPSPNYPTPSKIPNPNCPAPNNDDLGNIPALAIRNNPFRISELTMGSSHGNVPVTAPWPRWGRIRLYCTVGGEKKS
jgi:hypothetical protein